MKNNLHAGLMIRLYTEQKCFGPGVARLLRGVERCRSLRAAAQSMEMAYSKAWTVIHTAEEGLGIKLLRSAAGGRGGGGATLTEEALELLSAYESYCADVEAYAKERFAQCFAFYNEMRADAVKNASGKEDAP